MSLASSVVFSAICSAVTITASMSASSTDDTYLLPGICCGPTWPQGQPARRPDGLESARQIHRPLAVPVGDQRVQGGRVLGRQGRRALGVRPTSEDARTDRLG